MQPGQFKVCPVCHTAAALNANHCGQCGHGFSTQFANQTQMFTAPQYAASGAIQVPAGTHPVSAVIICSIFIGGWVGMILNKQVAKGLLFGLLGGIVFSVVTCGYGFFIWYPLALADAIVIANKLNRGEPVREWQFF